MTTPSVSVVICTYNRAEGLRATLGSLTRQRYEHFEVVVVNGPSTDHTEQVVAQYDGVVKLVRCPERNLSMSRNIGIRAAAGELVAFIDDDALPEPVWLEQIVAGFDDESVAGVGGLVLDHTGTNPQYVYSAANRFGEPSFSSHVPFTALCLPGADTFPYLQGTNAVFRRDALGAIGLFDETYEYYLDETDVCCRLVDAGYVLRQLATAPVHHKYLPSDVRNHERIITNWYPVVKNHMYFGYRHALGAYDELTIIDRGRAFIERLVGDTASHERHGKLPSGHTQAARAACGRGFAAGIHLGVIAGQRSLPPVRLEPGDLRSFPVVRPASTRHRVVVVSSSYEPRVNGGIARFMSDVAPELAARGHDIRVITAAAEHATVDLEHGVWVHRVATAGAGGVVPDAPPAIDAFASAAAAELARISPWFDAQLAYGPLWDVELLGIARSLDVPTVPMLATPVAEVAQQEGWFSGDAGDSAQALMQLEIESIVAATIIHGISDAIVATMDKLYGEPLDHGRVQVAHIGRRDEGEGTPEPGGEAAILFVGRLEPRKGIDVFLDAALALIRERPSARFVVAGNSMRRDDDGRTYPERWAAMAGDLASQLTFVGEVDDARLSELYERASIVVMPSRYESFGLVAVEAMMHGRAVVASSVGGLPELIEHDVTGVLVPSDSPKALAAELLRLVDEPSIRRRLARDARSQYARRLTIDAAADRLEQLFDRVVDLGDPATSPDRRSWSAATTGMVRAALAVQVDGSAVVEVDGLPVPCGGNGVVRVELPVGRPRVEVRVLTGTASLGRAVGVRDAQVGSAL